MVEYRLNMGNILFGQKIGYMQHFDELDIKAPSAISPTRGEPTKKKKGKYEQYDYNPYKKYDRHP